MLLTMNTVIKYLEKPNAQKVCLKIGTRVSLQSGPDLTVWCWSLHRTHHNGPVRHGLLQWCRQNKNSSICAHIYWWIGAKWLVCFLGTRGNITPIQKSLRKFYLILSPWPIRYFILLRNSDPCCVNCALYVIVRLHNTRTTCDMKLSFG